MKRYVSLKRITISLKEELFNEKANVEKPQVSLKGISLNHIREEFPNENMDNAAKYKVSLKWYQEYPNFYKG